MSKQTEVEIINVGVSQNKIAMFDLPNRSLHHGGSSYEINYADGSTAQAGQQLRHVPFGEMDDFPERADQLLDCDPHANPTIEKNVNFILGTGLVWFRERKVEGKRQIEYLDDKDPWNLFLETLYSKFKNQFDDSFEGVTMNNQKYGNGYVEFLLGKYGDRIIDFQNVDCHFARPLPIQEGQTKPSQYVVYTNRNQYVSSVGHKVIPVFDPKEPRKYSNFIVHIKNPKPGDPYFGAPIWVGSKKELELRRIILTKQIEGLDDANIKYHIEVDEKFYKGCNDEREKRARKQKLVSELKALFKGNDNITMVTEMFMDHAHRYQYSGVKITAINNTMIDTTLTRLLEFKQNSQPVSFGLDAGLAGFASDNNMSSGSEMKNKYNIHLCLNVPKPRQRTLKIMEVFRAVYNIPNDIKFSFMDAEITTMDQNPNGIQNVVTQ